MLLELAVLSAFRCAQEINKITETSASSRISSEADIVYALSGESPSERQLIVLNERAIAVFEWRKGVSRMRARFSFHAPDPRHPQKSYYLKIGSNSLIGVRDRHVFQGAPPGESAPSDFPELDYVPMPTRSALNKFTDSLYSEIKSMQGRMKAGYLARHELLKGNLALCRLSPELKHADLIRSYVDELIWVSAPAGNSRLPAGF